MKRNNSQLRNAKDAGYNFLPEKQFPFLTLQEAAEDLDVSPQRLSRLLRILSVPVFRRGYVIFLDRSALKRVRDAVTNKEVKRGRKKKSETA